MFITHVLNVAVQLLRVHQAIALAESVRVSPYSVSVCLSVCLSSCAKSEKNYGSETDVT